MNPTSSSLPRALVAAVAVVLVSATSLAPSLPAVSSRTWKQRERADFDQGEPHGVALSADGPIRLGSRLDVLTPSNQPYLWAIAADAHGVLYAAGGNEGRIDRIQPDGKSSPFFEVEDPEVQSLAVDAAGALYAGTAPGGKVYKIGADGKRIWVAETGESYVWALLFDRHGSLFAATGTRGRVVRIDPQGGAHLYYDSAETHIRTLALDAKGDLVAGTDGHGLILRITSEGHGTVVYDAPLAEVTALAPAPDGTIYAAVAGESGGRPAPRPAPQRPPGTPGPPTDGGEPPPAPQPPPDNQPQGSAPEQRITVGMEGKVLAISPDGYAREVWSAGQEIILSLALQRDGSLLMGSGSQGRLYVLDSRRNVSEVARSASSQVTALLRGAGAGGKADDVIVAGSNLGSLSILKPGFAEKGDFQSKTLDAQSFAQWGRATWRGDVPAGTSISLQARSGNTDPPDRTWSDWGAELTDAHGSLLDCPSARFVQWRALLKSSDRDKSPELREVDVVYMQRNLPPEFRKLEVLPPGVSLQAVPASGPGPEGKAPGGDSDNPRHRPRPQSRRGFDPGARSVSWQVTDPNDDDVTYDVQFKEIGDRAWRTIRTGIDEDFVSFDGSALPDGTYEVRVVASDAVSNPAGLALTAEKISPPFDVDNTPPRIEHLKARVEGGTLHVSFTAVDGFSVLREASWSVDAGDWILARPADGLSDSGSEEYDLSTPSPGAGEHSIVVRVPDAAGNVGSGRIVVQVP
jgi:sugar lactone lactonase YvrE